jgi:predicted GNAT superfamily acetyltransferase
MSKKAIDWVLDNSPYKGSTFLLHLCIATQVTGSKGNTFSMSNKNLAKLARISRETTNKALAKMVEDGFLYVDEQFAGSAVSYILRMEEDLENHISVDFEDVDIEAPDHIDSKSPLAWDNSPETMKFLVNKISKVFYSAPGKVPASKKQIFNTIEILLEGGYSSEEIITGLVSLKKYGRPITTNSFAFELQKLQSGKNSFDVNLLKDWADQ